MNQPLAAQSIETHGSIALGDHMGEVSPGTVRWTGKDFQGWNGDRWVSLTGPSFGTVMDIDDNIYRTVVIGDQEWMAENLRVTQYNDGTILFASTSVLNWNSANNLKFGSYAAYDFDEINAAQYGYLYNGYVLESDFEVCPVGWHIPTDLEFVELVDFTEHEIFNQGGNLKSTGFWESRTGLWLAPNTNATDAYGFAALPAGVLDGPSGIFFDQHETSFFWNLGSSVSEETYGTIRLVYDDDVLGSSIGNLDDGLSIRCIKD